jgi:hypothetical protein
LAGRRSWMGMGEVVGSSQPLRVVEPELDMNRRGSRIPPGIFRLREMLRVLVPTVRLTGPPMRSVDRELQEAWPSRDR